MSNPLARVVQLRRSLFAKILVWFVLTVVLTISGTFYVYSILRSRQQQTPPQFRGQNTYELRSARAAWEHGGKPALAKVLSDIKDAWGRDVYLADSNGIDLLSGRDWTKEIQEWNSRVGRGGGGRGGRDTLFFPFVRVEGGGSAPLTIGASLSKDGKYYFVSVLPVFENPERRVEVPSSTWWMLGIFVILCYILARHLTSPLRTMQKTIERFGHGDFTARVNSKRADELGDLGRTVDTMAERIENLVRSQRRLLQDISHELRSPLARLGVAVELARGGAGLENSLNRIEREGERLNTLVGELIQVTRAEGDPRGLATETVRLDELIQTIVDDVHIEAERRLVTINSNLNEATLEGNPELLRRAVENIVRNAIRYSPEGSTVDVALVQLGSIYRISVRDHGAGVPEDSLASIFDPFYRVEKDRGRTSGGVGLGLAIAKRAVDVHHGGMRAANVNPGLRVEIDLPVTPFASEPPLELTSSRS